MLEGKQWYVVNTKTWDDTRPGGYAFHAMPISISRSNNLLAEFNDDWYSVNACQTKKEAFALAEFWNECYMESGTHQ